jgi:NAD(P)-dependent dehydrogenase (short-subunit alcohol dehydrogenase family)
MMTELRRVAVVTGANRGLGHGIARQLADHGLHVVITARAEHEAQAAANDLATDGRSVSSHQLDVTDPASVARTMADVAFTFGRLDVLVNNAAVAIDGSYSAAAADMERVRITLDTNIIGAWRCCAAAIPEMMKNHYGRIVNISSHLGTFAEMDQGSAAYRISKAGLNALTRVLAAELHATNVLVNAMSPGRVDTRLAYGNGDRTADEAARTVIWLATLPDDGPTGGLFHDHERLDW